MKRYHESTYYEACAAAVTSSERPSILSSLPGLEDLRLRAMQFLHQEDLARRGQLSNVGTLQQQILAASRLVPPALRLDAQRLGSLDISSALMEITEDRLLMAEALGCLAGFRSPTGQSLHDEATGSLPRWSPETMPGLTEEELELSPPCTPDQLTCIDDRPWSSYEQANARRSASRESLCNRSAQGANKLRRIVSMSDVTRQAREPIPLVLASSLPSEGFHVPSRSASLDSVIRDILEPSTGEKSKKCGSAKEFGCSNSHCGAQLESVESLELQESLGGLQGVRCELCGQPCPKRQLAVHRQHLCLQVDVTCPKGCDWTGRREFLKTHLEEVCPAVVVPCSFAASGCPAHVLRGKLRTHLVEDVQNHLLLMAHENRLLRTHLYKMGESQILLQSRLENLETVVMLPDHGDEAEDDDTASVCSSASNAGN